MDEREQDQRIPEGTKTLRIQLAPHADLEAKAVTGVIVNFSGEEFVITMFQSIPQAYRSTDDIPDEIEGKVLFRAVISPQRWADVIESGVDQIAKLRQVGMLRPREENEED